MVVTAIEGYKIVDHPQFVVLRTQVSSWLRNKLGTCAPSTIASPYKSCLFHSGNQILAELDLLISVEWDLRSIWLCFFIKDYGVLD